MQTKINEIFLEEKMIELEKARAWSPRVTSKVEHFIRTAQDHDLFRINPVQFAVETKIAEEEAVDLFLYGTKLGLFTMNWSLICPSCGGVIESLANLKSLHASFYCSLCDLSTLANMDDYIQVSFTINKNIREISLHNRDSLSIEDYFTKYAFSKEGKFKNGLRLVDQLVKSAVDITKVISYIMPKDIKTFEINTLPGGLFMVDAINHVGCYIEVESLPFEISARNIHIVAERKILTPNFFKVNPGILNLEVENKMESKIAIAMMYMDPQAIKYKNSNPGLQFDPFLTGRKLINIQTFRDLFRSEVIDSSEGIGVKDITILFTDLKGSTALYEKIGDLKAFSLIRQHFDSLGRAINENSGVIVKTIGDAVMATFLSPVDALKSALEMLKEIEKFNNGLESKDIILKIGFHKGSSIAVTLNDRLDYFGQTVNVAARVQGLADSEEIYITDDIYNYPGIKEILDEYEIKEKKAKLKGVQEEMNVYRITHNAKRVS